MNVTSGTLVTTPWATRAAAPSAPQPAHLTARGAGSTVRCHR
jgi:hypothetical protein